MSKSVKNLDSPSYVYTGTRTKEGFFGYSSSPTIRTKPKNKPKKKVK